MSSIIVASSWNVNITVQFERFHLLQVESSLFCDGLETYAC